LSHLHLLVLFAVAAFGGQLGGACLGAMAYPWEAREADWEHRVDNGGPAGEDLEFDYDAISQEDAGIQLADFLIQLKRKGVLSAQNATILAFWAAKAGAVGFVNQLGTKPGRQSGKYSKHFDDAVGVDLSDTLHYDLPMPLFTRHDASRTQTHVQVLPAHEALADEAPELRVALRAARVADELPPVYYDHPVVRDAGPDVEVHPLAIYLDGVKFAPHDSVIGIFMYSILTGTRHLLCTLRKSELCKCGCRGYSFSQQFGDKLTPTSTRPNPQLYFTPRLEATQSTALQTFGKGLGVLIVRVGGRRGAAGGRMWH